MIEAQSWQAWRSDAIGFGGDEEKKGWGEGIMMFSPHGLRHNHLHARRCTCALHALRLLACVRLASRRLLGPQAA